MDSSSHTTCADTSSNSLHKQTATNDGTQPIINKRGTGNHETAVEAPPQDQPPKQHQFQQQNMPCQDSIPTYTATGPCPWQNHPHQNHPTAKANTRSNNPNVANLSSIIKRAP